MANTDWEIEFYEDDAGFVPAQDYIGSQAPKVQAKILRYLDMLGDFGLSLGTPYVYKLTGTDLWELRIKHSSNIYRILYVAHTGRKFVLLHGFTKKSQKTPIEEIKRATKRLNDYKGR